MRLVINIFLFVVIIGLVWLLIQSIREPIAFNSERTKREQAVVAKLMEIRKAQEAFRDIKGGFAPTFDSLRHVLMNDSFRIVQVFGDPDDPNYTGAITYDTLYYPAIDSIRALGINLDSLRFVPFGRGEVFEIQADTLTYQSTLVNVVEVGVRRSVFMGPYADPRYARYDKAYNPNSIIKFGTMTAPNLSGNWEGR
ncbi:MAG TPA: hypothetical protein PKC76_07515 [Saprospiraceae bacterium]|mgnify:FL=1|nr:hypothetical protein [Saprospiraceae bacterium]HMP23961.1 hypothetical protein [Saprospiraceae bacterium]